MSANKPRVSVHRESGFHFDSITEAAEAFQAEGKQPQSSANFIYTRYGNPNVVSAEQRLAELQGAAPWSVLTPSGMAAIDIALSVIRESTGSGPWLFSEEIYGGTKLYIDNVLTSRGVSTELWKHNGQRYTAQDFEEEVLKVLDSNSVKPSLLFFETISNPLLIVPEARHILTAARQHRIPVIVDNTMATPQLWSPLADGATLVVDSATKYFGGHGNLTAGVISGTDIELRDKVRKYRKLVGSILSPDDAYRLETQLTTFPMRFSEQCRNAHRLAEELDEHKHPEIAEVLYPGLSTHPTFKEAEELFKGQGFGAMITLELRGGRKACDLFVEAVRESIPYVPTFGDARSMLMHPQTAFGNDIYPKGMLRLSVGFEPYERLRASILEGLSRIKHLTSDPEKA